MAELRFSRRTGWNTGETEWARVLRERREDGLPVCDLTASNPTRCGFEYDSAAILAALQAPGALDYDPNPKGMQQAREAVAAYYADHGAKVDPEHIFLTTGTSEGYSFLFRLLCDPGDEVLIAQPSYPLFDFLADLDDVRLVPYRLFYDYGWHLDGEGLRRAITSRTRAIVVVHPNNPTGHSTKSAERKILEEICAEFGLALIVDEVFLDYPLESLAQSSDPVQAQSFSVGPHPAPTFVLSGLSKVCALPQMKAAWIACFGPESILEQALERLDVIADTFLSMNAPVQLALPGWLADRSRIQQQIRSRTRKNLAALDKVFPAGNKISRLAAESGWYVVLRIPATGSDEITALHLLREYGVAVHTGNFFGFGHSGWLVLSLLSDSNTFTQGINRIDLLHKASL